jgi:hypothetical protein
MVDDIKFITRVGRRGIMINVCVMGLLLVCGNTRHTQLPQTRENMTSRGIDISCTIILKPKYNDIYYTHPSVVYIDLAAIFRCILLLVRMIS